LAILYVDIKIMEDVVMVGALTATLGWINACMYCNWYYNCFVCCP